MEGVWGTHLKIIILLASVLPAPEKNGAARQYMSTVDGCAPPWVHHQWRLLGEVHCGCAHVLDKHLSLQLLTHGCVYMLDHNLLLCCSALWASAAVCSRKTGGGKKKAPIFIQVFISLRPDSRLPEQRKTSAQFVTSQVEWHPPPACFLFLLPEKQQGVGKGFVKSWQAALG